MTQPEHDSASSASSALPPSSAASPAAAPSAPNGTNPPSAPRLGKWRRHPWAIVAAVALALAAWQWLETRWRLNEAQQELGRRLADSDTVGKENRALARQSQEEVARLQAKLGSLEGKLAETQAQQSALENLYQELARNRDDWLIADIEQSVTLAAQQLQLANNVPAAVLALQAADARLARAERPQLLLLRKAVSRDLERLKALPFVDLPGMSLRLENIVASVDGLPLAADERPRPTPPAAAKRKPEEESFASYWQRFAGELWNEVRALVRIERMDSPAPALLAPEQAFFLRENLKLRLLNARLALFAHDQWTFRNELKQAQQWLERYFDPREKAVQAASAGLRQLAATEIVIELPNLNESLSALRAAKPVAAKAGGKSGGKDSR